ncbi:MAG: CBS domain-containing protein [Anaerolineaceae bacterium]|nr:CBS domain-containing protein [Anaerolineaceae bacterium]MBN2678279.1 CBS domain-containing protein [Anaerolineaceae bacterium]
MEFTVKDWMMDTIIFLDPDDSVADALKTMRRRYIHSVIIRQTPNNPECGILTSTDISDQVIAMGKNPSKLKLKEIMHSPLITINADVLLKDCAAKMKQHKIHHMPVTDDKGNLIGMISATDFLVAAEAMIED